MCIYIYMYVHIDVTSHYLHLQSTQTICLYSLGVGTKAILLSTLEVQVHFCGILAFCLLRKPTGLSSQGVLSPGPAFKGVCHGSEARTKVHRFGPRMEIDGSHDFREVLEEFGTKQHGFHFDLELSSVRVGEEGISLGRHGGLRA